MTAPSAHPPIDQRGLERFVWLSLGVSVVVLAIKLVAAVLTGSVGLWSDALESTVNVVAAGVALWAMKLSAKPADHNHDFGHGKAEYFSAAIEGAMIFVAAGVIVVGAVLRFFRPVELERLDLGLLLSAVATVINLAVGLVLVRAGRRYRSITLEADGKHLLTDVWTSAGVLVAIGLVLLTGWVWFDPLIALLVGLNILYTGYGLVRRATVGLLDGTLPPQDVATVNEVLHELAGHPAVQIAEIKTRESGRQRFVYATITVPGEWTVKRSHDLADDVEHAVARALPGTTTFVHIEPSED
ncbi:MAG: cation diffusion facilitator family transporter [Propionicimonas sp.]|uniref:cation diffusion facilitator family transporter n=1 Tax=Propionicimonas sp. TaxID=1955623 RepID=UPI002B201E6F|nr:cation diffusion facilitator family transporter [Propionicimonas sp.]MEA4942916.1 cation diffusion facilitator family transporter [Propionicimonas sp.]MEA5054484.1 cation diffusion facilitator family transporter [Propionicimonas sp.]MEA5117400.1 cation diffusion facilitator family transporter [Propionicimonas sp.]